MTNDHFPHKEEEYTALITSEVLPDGSVTYVAVYPELDGCMSHGDTEQEARENLSEAFALTIEHLLKYGLEVPAPRASAVERFVMQSYFVSDQPTASVLVMVTGSTHAVSLSAPTVFTSPEQLMRNLYFDAFSKPSTHTGASEVLADAN